MNIATRLSKLELANPELSPAIRAWLGQPLTASERASLDDRAGIDADFDDFDLSGLSREAQEWLTR